MTMHGRATIAGLLSLWALGGCGADDAPAATFDTEGWIDIGAPSPPGERPGVGAGGGEDDEGDEDDEDDTESGTFCGLFGPYTDGQLSELEGEYFVMEGGEEVCLLFFPATVVGPADGCTECTAAWEIELGAPETEIDVDGGCARHPAGPLEGTRLRLGIAADEELLRDDGTGWASFGEFFVEDGEIALEWTHGATEPE